MKGIEIIGIVAAFSNLPENGRQVSKAEEVNQRGLTLIEILFAIGLLLIGLILLSNLLDLMP